MRYGAVGICGPWSASSRGSFVCAGQVSWHRLLNFAKLSVERDVNTTITAEEISSPIFFDIRFVEGQYQIIINKKHPAYLDFFNLLEKESAGKNINEPSSDRAIKLMLGAWAALEDEASSDNTEYSNYLEDIRLRWGQIFRDLLLVEKN